MEKQEQVSVPDPVDVYVGQRIKARRKMLGLTQTELGNALGVTFQQVQKYERGTNRVGSSRLFCISRTLNVTVGYFFEGVETRLPDFTDNIKKMVGEVSDSDESKNLLNIYYQIKNPRVRAKVLSLASLLA